MPMVQLELRCVPCTCYILQTGTNKHIDQDSLATGYTLVFKTWHLIGLQNIKTGQIKSGTGTQHSHCVAYGIVRGPGVPLNIIISTIGLSLKLRISGKDSYFGRMADRQHVNTEMSIEMSGWLNDNFIVFDQHFYCFGHRFDHRIRAGIRDSEKYKLLLHDS